jgi:hypothetical protein
MPALSKASSLAEAKLQSSGLTAKDAKLLRIHALSRQETQSLHPSFKPVCSLKLEYFDHKGKPATDWPGVKKQFYRLRYLEAVTDFDALTGKPPKYVQEPNTAPVAYFAPNQNWIKILNNPNEPLIITEGELKAAKACKEGFPTIGLGGVYNWRSVKLGLTWLPGLEPINWLRRNVYICFDTDYKTNTNVCNALRELADELHRRGAFAHVVSLPEIKDVPKVGLDDFLVHAGHTAKEQLKELLNMAEPLGLTEPLFSMNEKYLYVKEPGLVLNQATSAKSSPSAFRDHLESTKRYQERALMANGKVSYQGAAAGAAWLAWPLRHEVTKLTYEPGKPKFHNSNFNIWPGWGVEPKKGDVKPFLQLVDHLFTNAEPAAKAWFLQWCAYPLQFPGTKLFSSVVFHGIRHGTGKSFLGFTMGRIYGKNFTEISQLDLHNNFNEWAEGKQFVMGDDVTGPNKRSDADFLKKLITQRELRVNGKYVPTYTVRDCVNYFFTANHPDSFFLEDDDRRFFIHEVQVGPLAAEFYKSYETWLDSGGSNAVFDYLLKLSLAGFNPSAAAHKTLAKERMIATVQSDLAAWARQLKATPDQVLRVGEVVLNKDLFTSRELLDLYDPMGKTGTTANGLGREMLRAGFRQVLNGKPVRLKGGFQGRYFPVRNTETWLNGSKTATAMAKHLDDFTQGLAEPKKAKY